MRSNSGLRRIRWAADSAWPLMPRMSSAGPIVRRRPSAVYDLLPGAVSRRFGRSWWTSGREIHAFSSAASCWAGRCACLSCWSCVVEVSMGPHGDARRTFNTSHPVLGVSTLRVGGTAYTCLVRSLAGRVLHFLASRAPPGREPYLTLRFLPQDFHTCGKHCGKALPGEVCALISPRLCHDGSQHLGPNSYPRRGEG